MYVACIVHTLHIMTFSVLTVALACSKDSLQGSKLTFWCTGPLSSAFRFSLDKMYWPGAGATQIISLNIIKVK